MLLDRQLPPIDRVAESYRAYCMAVASGLPMAAAGADAGPSDLAHEALITVVKKARDGSLPMDDETHLRRLIRTIVIRIHLSRLRRKNRMRHGGGVRFSGVDEAPIDPGTSPSGKAARGEARGLVAAAFRQLSDRDRELIRLRYVEEVSCAEIGLRFGYSSEYASRATRAALRRLEAALPSFGGEA